MELQKINEKDLITINNNDTSLDKEAEEDLQEARETYKTLIKRGIDSLDMADEMVQDSGHPRSVEVFAGLINSISDVNSKLINLHKVKNEMKSPGRKNEGGQVTNNNAIFVGNPAELQALIAGTK